MGFVTGNDLAGAGVRVGQDGCRSDGEEGDEGNGVLHFDLDGQVGLVGWSWSWLNLISVRDDERMLLGFDLAFWGGYRGNLIVVSFGNHATTFS